MNHSKSSPTTDIVLIGTGIMSATLGVLLKELDPNIRIDIFEKLDQVAGESTAVWNNAGTGHAGYCELNYTPELSNGKIDISKALKVNQSFEESLQFWKKLSDKGILQDTSTFLNKVPHISFVMGEDNVNFLKKRYIALKKHHSFSTMEYSEDHHMISKWAPLVMEGRNPYEKCAATRIEGGTDVNFGELTRQLFDYLKRQKNVRLHFHHKVKSMHRLHSGNKWNLTVKDLQSKSEKSINSSFVFLGAGGGTLPLLLKSGIPEGKKYGGFPVSGQWLKCNHPETIAKHHAKVYGKAAQGAPPMSVPHLDSRYIDGKKELLFGPYAGFTTKFLKKGSYWDFPRSIKKSNIQQVLSAGINNIPLTKYLIQQVSQSQDERMKALKVYFPNANAGDWELEEAGKRVQLIKKDDRLGGVLEFGTEVVTSSDNSLAALLGASPGASTSYSIMLSLVEKCWPTIAEGQNENHKIIV